MLAGSDVVIFSGMTYISLVRCRAVCTKKIDATTGAITIIADVLEDEHDDSVSEALPTVLA